MRQQLANSLTALHSAALLDERAARGRPRAVFEHVSAHVGISGNEEADRLAVLGRSSTLRELADLSGDPTPEIAAKLGALERRQVVLCERGAGPALRYDFVPLLARDAVYQSLEPAHRCRLHEQAIHPDLHLLYPKPLRPGRRTQG